MLKRTFSKTIFVLVLGAIFLSLPMDTFAQRRVKPKPKKVKVVAPMRHAPNIVKLPVGYKTIAMGGVYYYHHHGVFYKKGPSGYAVVRAPIGVNIKTLPAGYVTIHIRNKPYYHYYGTYYVYEPEEKVYVVVEPPSDVVEAEEDIFDKITLIDGSTLEGIYLGGTKSTVQFEVAGEIREFSVTEIVTLRFAPPVAD